VLNAGSPSDGGSLYAYEAPPSPCVGSMAGPPTACEIIIEGVKLSIREVSSDQNLSTDDRLVQPAIFEMELVFQLGELATGQTV
jgi:hypothetical protein